MRKSITLSLLVLAIVLISCRMHVLRGNGEIGTISPELDNYTGIAVRMLLKLTIKVQDGATPNIQITGSENILKHIKPKVENGILYIKSDLDNLWTIDFGDALSGTITLPALNYLSIDGMGNADIHGNIAGNELKLVLSGASTLIFDSINVTNLTMDASGATNIEINGGKVKHAVYEVSGAGKIKAFPLQADNVEVSFSGAGKGQITALTKLNASISGAGTIKYKGNPTISQDISGAGALINAN